ncbi:hypothetical protein D1631_16275 [Chryseobacterium nematophagum]|uniref:Transposase IS204/IS1001/IS1096/IS1165 DDE domain-containing protein n=1 Tax=Chryseobacterium nematophagum TaxID=2305228 RepID=A0A3M7TK15_9FLAO|nr:hypothetical protein D1631_16275 [Chryseobacterium nematophagum]
MEEWSKAQRQRVRILFLQYSDLEKAYHLKDKLRKIYNQNITKSIVMTKLAR